MHALKVYVDDSVFDKVMSFLKNLPAHQVKVDIEPTTRSNSVNFTQSFQPFHKHVSTFLTVN